MKKRKIKLFASVASLALVAAVASIGVFAATSASTKVTTNIGFTATANVEAYITGSCKIMDEGVLPSTGSNGQYAWFGTVADNYTTAAGEGSMADLDDVTDNPDGFSFTGTVDVGNTDPADPATTVVFEYTLVITNNAKSTLENDALKVTFSDLAQNPENSTVSYKISAVSDGVKKGADTVTANSTLVANADYIIPQAGSMTITVQVTIDNYSVSITEEDYGFSIALAMVAGN